MEATIKLPPISLDTDHTSPSPAAERDHLRNSGILANEPGHAPLSTSQLVSSGSADVLIEHGGHSGKLERTGVPTISSSSSSVSSPSHLSQNSVNLVPDSILNHHSQNMARTMHSKIYQASTNFNEPFVTCVAPDIPVIGEQTESIQKAKAMLLRANRPLNEIREYISLSESYFIDGDALVFSLASSTSSIANPYQTLSVFYLIERYLADLKQYGGKFLVIFFASSRIAYTSLNPMWFAISLLLQRHLMRLTSIQVKLVDRCDSEEYNALLEEFQPGFILTTVNARMWGKKASIPNANAKRMVLRTLCFHIGAGITVVDVKDVKFGDTTRLAIVEIWNPSLATELWPGIRVPPSPRIIDVMNILFNDETVPSDWLMSALVRSYYLLMDDRKEKILGEGALGSRPLSWVSMAIDIVLRISLGGGVLQLSRVKIFLIYSVIQSHLGIYDRVELEYGSLDEEANESRTWQVSSFIRLLICVSAHMASLGDPPSQRRFDVADIFDITLYSRVFNQLRILGIPCSDPQEGRGEFQNGAYLMRHAESTLGFNLDMLSELELRWNYISAPLPSPDDANEDINTFYDKHSQLRHFFPFIIETSADAKRSSNKKSPSVPKSGSSAQTTEATLWPVRYRLADSVMGADGTPLPTQTPDHFDRYQEALTRSSQFEDNRHWRSGRFIDSAEIIYMDHGLSGKQTVERYVRALAQALLGTDTPPIPPLLNEGHFYKEALRKNARHLPKSSDKDLPIFFDLPADIREWCRQISLEIPKTASDSIIRLKDLVWMNYELYKRLSAAAELDQTGVDDCRAQMVGMLFKAINVLYSTPFWSNFGLGKLFGEVYVGMGLPGLNSASFEASTDISRAKGPPRLPARLQLSYMGPLMQKDTQSVVDSRVSFRPDPWQVEVLDGIDACNSLLVTAPTSSGKSFISFYAMERQLVDKNFDSIVIFVAPTIALVNQVQAEVYLKFGRNYPQSNGISLYGSFTRDMRVVPTNCRILVTVPACLEILLLSPPLQLSWVPRIRYIIFDEIHTISADESSSLARMLALAPCPFIALSATIGSPHQFHEYLKTLCSRNVVFIEHTKRYNDIEKHFLDVVLGETISEGNPDESKASGKFLVNSRYWHPWNGARLSFFDHGIPPAPFSPKDSLVLYEAIEKTYATSNMGSIAEDASILSFWQYIPKLAPESFFANCPVVSQADAREYEHILKDWYFRLVKVSKEVRNTHFAESVLIALNAPIAGLYDNTARNPTDMKAQFSAHVLKVVQRLQGDDKLPAIFFNFERAYCEDIARYLFDHFASNDTPEAGLPLRASESARVSEKDNRKVIDRNLAFSASESESDRLSVPKLRRLTLDGEVMSPYSLNTELESLKKLLESTKDGKAFLWAVDAIRYGVGIHHSGMRKEYRDAVERYFRLRQIKVVFATGTLAVGINMPCRSTVFMGDSQYLTPQQYRQMCGRAGRRGIDPLGHAYFWGIPVNRIAHLELSQLSPIIGYFPLSISTTLRATILDEHHRSLTNEISPEVSLQIDPSNRLFNLYGRSLYVHSRTERWAQIWIHTACAMEYLVSEGMMSLDGTPLNLAGLVSHIHWTEPSNLVVAKFLVSPLAMKMALRWTSDRDEVGDELIHFFATLFNRYPAPKLGKRLIGEARLEGCHHSFVLDPLPQILDDFITRHRTQCFDVANRVIETFVDTHLEGSKIKQMQGPTLGVATTIIEPVVLHAETSLPLSGELEQLTFDPFTLNPGYNSDSDPGNDTEDVPNPTLLSCLLDHSTPPKLLSPFAAMSSKRDNIASVADLRLLRRGLELSNLALLSDQELLTSQNSEVNAYVLDMYRFNNYDWLVKYNRIRANELRTFLKDFLLVILTIARSCALFFTEPREKPLVDMLNDVSRRFNHQYATLFATELVQLPTLARSRAKAYNSSPNAFKPEASPSPSPSPLSRTSPQNPLNDNSGTKGSALSYKSPSNKATPSQPASSSSHLVSLSSFSGNNLNDDQNEFKTSEDASNEDNTAKVTLWCKPIDEYDRFSKSLLSGPLPPSGDDLYAQYSSIEYDRLYQNLKEDFEAFWIRRALQYDQIYNGRFPTALLDTSYHLLSEYPPLEVELMKKRYLLGSNPSTLTIHELAARVELCASFPNDIPSKLIKMPVTPLVPSPNAVQLLYRVAEFRAFDVFSASSLKSISKRATAAALKRALKSGQVPSEATKPQTLDITGLSPTDRFIALSCHPAAIHSALSIIGLVASAIEGHISDLLIEKLTELKNDFELRKTSPYGPHTLTRTYLAFFKLVPLLEPIVRFTVDLKSMVAILDTLKSVLVARDLHQTLIASGSLSASSCGIQSDLLPSLAICPPSDAQLIRDQFEASKPDDLEWLDVMVLTNSADGEHKRGAISAQSTNNAKLLLLWRCDFNPFLFCFTKSHPMSVWTSNIARASRGIPLMGDIGIMALCPTTLGHSEIIPSSLGPGPLPTPSHPSLSISYIGSAGGNVVTGQQDGTITTGALCNSPALQAEPELQRCEYVIQGNSHFKYFVLVRCTKAQQ